MCQKPEVDSLTNDMSKLFVNKLMSDYQGQCTPVADRPNKTWTSKNLIIKNRISFLVFTEVEQL